MSRIFHLAAAAAIAAAAIMSLAALAGDNRANLEDRASCAAALCGLVIF